MRLLFVHADHLEFEAVTAAGEDPAETDAPMEGRMEDCVVVSATVERADEADPGAVVANGATEVRDVADQLNTRRVVLYPSAHLSNDLAVPDSATAVFRGLRTKLDGDFEVLRAPVGWYTAVEVAAKGHPLSVLSRRVTPERGAGAEDEYAGRPASEWKLAFPDGETVALPADDATKGLDAEGADRVSDDLRALVEYEVEGKRESEASSAGDRPPYVALLREQTLADYDDRADGTLRWYPRGTLVRDSLVEYVDDLAIEYGAIPVETTGGSDRGSSPDPLDFLHDLHFSEGELPIRIYEAVGRSVRREKAGTDVADRTRQQAFTTPGMYTAARDLEQAKDEFRSQAVLALRTGEDLDLNYVPAIRMTRELYDESEAWVESLVEDLDAPALLEILPERRHDWVARVDFAVVDGLDRPVVTATVQLDTERGELLDEDADQATHHSPVLHCSPTGGVERVLAALLERAAERETPRLPTWLSPTQVRFIPVGEAHVEYCDSLADGLEAAGVRADVDDRDETVGERLARAEADWMPYYAVVGDRELESDDSPFEVTVRGETEEREMDFETVRETVREDVSDLPAKRRYRPKRVSEHPDFTVDSQ
jgi:threonyl-tRNA synthetase